MGQLPHLQSTASPCTARTTGSAVGRTESKQVVSARRALPCQPEVIQADMGQPQSVVAIEAGSVSFPGQGCGHSRMLSRRCAPTSGGTAPSPTGGSSRPLGAGPSRTRPAAPSGPRPAGQRSPLPSAGHCIDGQADAANKRITDALSTPDAGQDPAMAATARKHPEMPGQRREARRNGQHNRSYPRRPSPSVRRAAPEPEPGAHGRIADGGSPGRRLKPRTRWPVASA